MNPENSTNIDDLVNRIAMGTKKNSSQSNKEKSATDINYEDVDFSELDNESKKVYSDLFKNMIDVYAIMGATPNESQESINKKCNMMLSKYHPDKIGHLLEKFPPEKRSAQKKKYDSQYKLVRQAYSILKDEKKRKYYDLTKKNEDSINFTKQKKSFEEFIKLQESEISDQSKESAKNKFKLESLAFDKKHGINRDAQNSDPISKSEMDRKLQDLQQSRDFDEIEYAPKNMFKGKNFNSTEFNRQWEIRQKKIDNKKSTPDDRSIIQWEGVSAANDTGLGGSSEFMSVNTDYSDLYVDNTAGSNYANKLGSDDEFSDGSETDDNSDNINVSYTTDHNKNNDDIEAKFKEYERSRQKDNEMFETREFNDKNAWKSVMENPMNISSQMGELVGSDTKMIEGIGKTVKKVDANMIDAYKQLIFIPDE